MGGLRRKTFTKPLPDGAEWFTRKGERFARWKDGRGKTRTAPIDTAADGSLRIVLVQRKWLAKYRNGNGDVTEVSTGCTDHAAAKQRLAELERQAERVRCGVATAAETKTVERQQGAIGDHIAGFLDHRKARGRCSRPKETRYQLERVAGDCGFSKLCEVDADDFETWLARQAEGGMSAGTRNKYRTTWLAFCNWAVRAGRMLRNPLANVAKADDRGRTVDVHALRHTFGTHLSKSGVTPRTAQTAMRHSDINLTMGVYTDPRLLDLSAAVESLPSLPLGGIDGEAGQATGTDGQAASISPRKCPPISPLPAGNLCKSEGKIDNNAKQDTELPKQEKPAVSLGKRGFTGVLSSGRHGTRTCDLRRVKTKCAHFGFREKIKETLTVQGLTTIAIHRTSLHSNAKIGRIKSAKAYKGVRIFRGDCTLAAANVTGSGQATRAAAGRPTGRSDHLNGPMVKRRFDAYNLIRPGCAGPQGLESRDAYHPGRFSCHDALHIRSNCPAHGIPCGHCATPVVANSLIIRGPMGTVRSRFHTDWSEAPD